MSSPNLRLAFTPQAREDYEDALLYSLREWGEDQRARYAAAVEAGFERLREFPNLGRARDDLSPGCRIYRVEQHLVIYSVRGTTLRILRLLHHRRDIARAMQDQP
jgi:toxin ParE1/3/4